MLTGASRVSWVLFIKRRLVLAAVAVFVDDFRAVDLAADFPLGGAAEV